MNQLSLASKSANTFCWGFPTYNYLNTSALSILQLQLMPGLRLLSTAATKLLEASATTRCSGEGDSKDLQWTVKM